MHFNVRALDARHELVELSIEALDETDARAEVALRSLTPLAIARLRQSGFAKGAFSLLLFAQELHALIVAGLSVIEALDALAEKETVTLSRSILLRLASSLRDGKRLSSALAEQPAFFPALFVGIVQAAESTSDLPRALGRYIEYETRAQSVRHKVLAAAIYPSVLLLVGGGVALFLVGYVVPRFAAVYRGSGQALPWASQLLLGWGSFTSDHAQELLLGSVTLALATAFWMRARWRRGELAQAVRWIPAARARLQQFELSRLYLTAGMLLEGGIPLPRALALSGAVLGHADRSALDLVRQRVERGESFSAALASGGLSTPIAERLLRVGEQSGQLGPMLTRAALFYEGETARWIERFSKTFEPVLMAAIGAVIGLIVILLYLPIFELAGSLP